MIPFTNFPIRLTKTYRKSMIDVTTHQPCIHLATRSNKMWVSWVTYTLHHICFVPATHIFFNTFFFYPLATPFQSYMEQSRTENHTRIFFPCFQRVEWKHICFFFLLLYFSVQRINYIKYVRLDQPTTSVESRLLPVNIIKIKQFKKKRKLFEVKIKTPHK